MIVSSQNLVHCIEDITMIKLQRTNNNFFFLTFKRARAYIGTKGGGNRPLQLEARVKIIINLNLLLNHKLSTETIYCDYFFQKRQPRTADENRQLNVDDGFLDNKFHNLTSTQNDTCGSPSKKNAIKKKPKNHSPSKTITGIFLSISKTVTLQLI